MHASAAHAIKLLTPTRPTIDYSPSPIAPTHVAAYPEPHNRAIHRARLTPASPAINASPHQPLRTPPPPTLYLVFGGSASGTARSSSCCRADVHIWLVSHFAPRSSETLTNDLYELVITCTLYSLHRIITFRSRLLFKSGLGYVEGDESPRAPLSPKLSPIPDFPTPARSTRCVFYVEWRVFSFYGILDVHQLSVRYRFREMGESAAREIFTSSSAYELSAAERAGSSATWSLIPSQSQISSLTSLGSKISTPLRRKETSSTSAPPTSSSIPTPSTTDVPQPPGNHVTVAAIAGSVVGTVLLLLGLAVFFVRRCRLAARNNVLRPFSARVESALLELGPEEGAEHTRPEPLILYDKSINRPGGTMDSAPSGDSASALLTATEAALVTMAEEMRLLYGQVQRIELDRQRLGLWATEDSEERPPEYATR
ncbi:hypothetical protein B0H17DRAFT_1141566 [Mycena rosella]|uniref:Uncharacterized protein n=1 Tax=Mycena rosella TaxID=1033263 RepID=A0AAD7D2Z8_MYCRO|nr:hypothetical protein B0H17DRAFT_1141566 [Mycena rosella]